MPASSSIHAAAAAPTTHLSYFLAQLGQLVAQEAASHLRKQPLWMCAMAPEHTRQGEMSRSASSSSPPGLKHTQHSACSAAASPAAALAVQLLQSAGTGAAADMLLLLPARALLAGAVAGSVGVAAMGAGGACGMG